MISLSAVHRKIGYKGWLVFVYWAVCVIGWLMILLFPSFADCGGGGGLISFNFCIPYGFAPILIASYPALGILNGWSRSFGANTFWPSFFLATLIYFCIGWFIDFLVRFRDVRKNER